MDTTLQTFLEMGSIMCIAPVVIVLVAMGLYQLIRPQDVQK